MTEREKVLEALLNESFSKLEYLLHTDPADVWVSKVTDFIICSEIYLRTNISDPYIQNIVNNHEVLKCN